MITPTYCKELLRRFGGSTKAAEAYAASKRFSIHELDEAHRSRPKGAVGYHKLGRVN